MLVVLRKVGHGSLVWDCVIADTTIGMGLRCMASHPANTMIIYFLALLQCASLAHSSIFMSQCFDEHYSLRSTDFNSPNNMVADRNAYG